MSALALFFMLIIPVSWGIVKRIARYWQNLLHPPWGIPSCPLLGGWAPEGRPGGCWMTERFVSSVKSVVDTTPSFASLSSPLRGGTRASWHPRPPLFRGVADEGGREAAVGSLLPYGCPCTAGGCWMAERFVSSVKSVVDTTPSFASLSSPLRGGTRASWHPRPPLFRGVGRLSYEVQH